MEHMIERRQPVWRKLEDEQYDRVEANEGRPGFGTTVRPGSGGAATMQRWVHADGRYAVHVSDADPEVLVLDADGVVIREYDLPGRAREPDAADPLKGAREVRAVGATVAEDAPTPAAEDADARWALLRGWS